MAEPQEGSNGTCPTGIWRRIRIIYYQYAKIIAHSALHAPDGTAAKAGDYGGIKQTFREFHKKSFIYLSRPPCSETGKLKGVPNLYNL